MGLLLKRCIGWAPSTWISKGFFEDALNIIGERIEYKNLVDEINDVVFFYGFTLDYRDKDKSALLPLYEIVIILIYKFDEMYKERQSEDAIKIYKESLLELKQIITDYILEY